MQTTQTRFGLTGNQLKLIALITMTIDHIGVSLLPQLSILRIIGRLAMPIYAYLIAEGCRYTRNKAKYLGLMAGLAAVCQLVYFFAMDSLYMCILVTFSMSIGLCYLAHWVRTSPGFLSWTALIAGLASAVFVCEVLPGLLPGTDYSVDYGIMGVLLPVLIFLGRDQKQRLSLAAVGLVLMNAVLGYIQWYSLAALVPLALYNGKRGRGGFKYLFYLYYPAHLVVIHLLSLIL